MPSEFARFNSAGRGSVDEVLIADRADEAEDRLGSDGGRAAIGGRGERAAMDHGVANLDAGREAVEKDAADLGFQEPG